MMLKRTCAAAAVAACAALAVAGDALSDYQARWQKGQDSDRDKIVQEIAATGRLEALKALQWCHAQIRQTLEDARKDSDKAQAKLVPDREAYEKRFHEWVDDEKKHGREPDVTHPPQFPEWAKVLEDNARVEYAEKQAIAAQIRLREVLDAHGDALAKLPPDAQKAVRDEWTKTRLNSKDWGVRGELYDMLGHAPNVDWARDILVGAVKMPDGTEPDPRALVQAVDGLAGKDAAKVTPALASRIEDVRWLVRAAVVAALERTPSKEGIDAIVKRLQKEDGRLKDDCAKALRSLTGQAMPPNPEMWRIWWEQNREKWNGKPPAVDPDKIDPLAGLDKKAEPNSGKTGFFGIQIESKRVVFVIDFSGSMTWTMGGNGPDAKTARAALAKEELKRCISGLEEGTLFDLVCFSSSVRVWKAEMQKVDAKTRAEARSYIDAAEVMGSTNTYDALEAAFALGDMGKGKKRESDPTGDARVDTIVLLSDGKPTVGRSTDPDSIRAAVREWNRARRIAIHTVAFGVQAAGGDRKAMEGADPKFMKGLADDTGGKYVEK